MNQLDQIESALAGADIDPTLFERCAQDLLIGVFPGLSPIHGGKDGGRDADIHGLGDKDELPIRLMITKSRDFAAIRQNMITGLTSLQKGNKGCDRVVLANLGIVNESSRKKLIDEAAKFGAQVIAIYDREFFASRVRRDGEWREKLLGLSGDPISLSRKPWRLAESRWSKLPLIGRSNELMLLASGTGDAIVMGMPGIGKTRLLAELDDVAFVDADATDGQISDDIRSQMPKVIVVDDVGQSERVVRCVQRLRYQEAELRSVRLVVTCWPDEVQAVRDLVPDALEVNLEQLERSEVNKIVSSMGVTSVVARQEILDQAEGRPGWAVSLTDLLLSSGWDSLLTGKSILGQVDRYLRMSGLSQNALDVLAVVAALRGCNESDLGALSTVIGISRTDVGRLLRVVAHGGMLDVGSTSGGRDFDRRYSVRPPILADALATEHFFPKGVPIGDIAHLLETWPERRVDLVRTVCVAARLGSERARLMVDSLVEEVATAGLDARTIEALYHEYLLVDERCGSKVIQCLREEFDDLEEIERTDTGRVKPVVNLAYAAANNYCDERAISLLLDVARFDPRPTHAYPKHPIRRLEDFCTRVHPEAPISIEHRLVIGEALNDFLTSEPGESHWRVWGRVARAALSPHVHSSFVSPEDRYQVQLLETIVSAEQAQELLDRVWPSVHDRLALAPTEVAAEFVNLIESWLRVGGGFDRPFGQEHPPEAIDGAMSVGRAMLTGFFELCRGRTALGSLALDAAEFSTVEAPDDLIAEIDADPFFRRFDVRFSGKSGLEELQNDVADLVLPWASEPVGVVVNRLVQLRAEIDACGRSWPNRIEIACEALAPEVPDPVAWIQEAVSRGLFPDALPFIRRVVADGHPKLMEVLQTCLNDHSARALAIEVAFSDPRHPDALNLVISQLSAADFAVLEQLAALDKLDPATTRAILTTAPEGGRGACVVALTGRRDNVADVVTDEILDDFLAAVELIRPVELGNLAEYELMSLVEYLAEHHPCQLERLVRNRLKEAEPGRAYSALTDEMWRRPHLLPRLNKTRILQAFPEPTDRWIILEHLAGPDVGWLAELLDQALIEPDDALLARSWHHEIAIEDMARLLVPRGVSPHRVATMAQFGSWVGPESQHYRALVKEFTALSASNDTNVAAVGKAGVEIFSRLSEVALAREHQERVRGKR